jgi:hypothetical protein
VRAGVVTGVVMMGGRVRVRDPRRHWVLYGLVLNFATGARLEAASMCLPGYEKRLDKGQSMGVGGAKDRLVVGDVLGRRNFVLLVRLGEFLSL